MARLFGCIQRPSGNVCLSTVTVAAASVVQRRPLCRQAAPRPRLLFRRGWRPNLSPEGLTITTATASAGSTSITVASTTGFIVGHNGYRSEHSPQHHRYRYFRYHGHHFSGDHGGFVGNDSAFTASCSDTTIHGYSVATHSLTPTIATAAGISIVPLSGGVLSDGRKLFVGSYDQTTLTATLHRFDLSTGTATTGNLLDGTLTEDAVNLG